MSSAGRYSRISRRIWNDERFRRLSRPQPCGQVLFMRLLAGPELTNIPGLFQAWESGLAESMGWSLKQFRESFGELLRERLVEADWDVGLVWIPKAIFHNEPANPNVVKSWDLAWSELPDCVLKSKAHDALEQWANGRGNAFADAFTNACRNHYVNHSPEPLGKPMPESGSGSGTVSGTVSPPTPSERSHRKPKAQESDPPESFEPDPSTLKAATESGRNWRSDWARCADWHRSKGLKKTDWQATLRNWMRKSADEKQATLSLSPNGKPAISAQSAGLPSM